MRNWPVRPHRWRERFWWWFNLKAIHCANQLPRMKRGPISNLQAFADRLSEERCQGDGFACPKDIELRPLYVTFFDCFSIEDFGSLKLALRKLLADLGETHGQSETATLTQWLDGQTYMMSPGSWARLNIFPVRNLQTGAKHCQNVWFYLHSITTSCVCLRIHVEPTSLFLARFQEIVGRAGRPEIDIDKLSMWRGIFSISSRTRMEDRQNEIEDLFLELNREVVSLLREHLDVGWCSRGPLPSIEAFLLEKGKFNNESDVSSFWMSLDMLPVWGYSGKGLHIFDYFSNGKQRLTRPYRVLIDKPVLLDDETPNVSGGGEKNALLLKSEGYLLPLFPLLVACKQAQRSFYEIARLRRELAPAPVHDQMRRFGFRGMRKAFRTLSELSGLTFLQRRMDAELDVDMIRKRAVRDLPAQLYRAGDPVNGEFTSRAVESIQWSRRYVRAQLSLFKEHYKEAIDYRLQRRVLWLAIIAVILAVLQFVPESTRLRPYSWLASLIKTLTTYFFN